MEGKFFETSDQSATYTSTKVANKRSSYTVAAILTGTFNVDVKLQSSVDGINFGDVLKADGTTAEFTGLTDSLEIAEFNVSTGFHRYVRLLITRNSGTFSATGYIK